MRKALKPEQLRKKYTPEQLRPVPLTYQPPVKAIIGQHRAIKALQFGLGNKSAGFNIFVSGAPEEGLMEAVTYFLEELAKREADPMDWCYVNNFQAPYCPKILSLAKGKAQSFKADIKKLIEESRQLLSKAFNSEAFAEKKDAVQKRFYQKEQALFSDLDQWASEEDFTIKRTPIEIIALPLRNGKPMADQDFFELNEADRKFILEKQENFKQELKLIGKKTRELKRQYRQVLKELEQKAAFFALESPLEELLDKYQDQKAIIQFINEVKEDIFHNLPAFLNNKKQKTEWGSLSNGQYWPRPQSTFFDRYAVNILVDNTETVGAPIVIETNPNYQSLFGKIEKIAQKGTLFADFTLIREGALHRANGGYLVLPVEELLERPMAWESLKRAIKNNLILIEETIEQTDFLATKSLKPHAIPLNVQVILIGRPYHYFWLMDYDEDFRYLFKVKVDFDNTMLPTQENIRDFSAFVSYLCKDEKLFQVDLPALASLLEYGHRLAESQKRISTRFGSISDIIREANHYAVLESIDKIEKKHIKKAIEEKVYRSSLYQEKYNEWVTDGTIILDLEGSVVGQINGLSVVDLGDIAFGHPTRITASISVGKGGVLDIEREAKLGGSIHTKGVLILSGYISELFGQDKPLSLTAQIVFEQSYGYIEGDSASSAELYALLSALAQAPINQGIAATGSVNQKGIIQSVGGINEKIEGFFELCSLNGLSGDQGVLIPASNVQHLILKEEVVQAVAKGQFHIWAVETIQEGIEILTGIHAGKYYFDADSGSYVFEENSIFDRINKKLIEMTMIDLNYGKEEEEE